VAALFIVNMRRLRSSGQTGLELIVSLVIALLVFMIVVLVAADNMAESSRMRTLIDARRVAGSIKDNINMISQQGPGYYSYVSLPERLQGGYDYRVGIRGSQLELMWEENTWTERLSSSNITVHCLSYGLDRKNRIYHGPGGIEVFCHLPNIRLLPATLEVNRPSGDSNVTLVNIINDAVADSPAFSNLMMTNGSQYSVLADPLPAGKTVALQFNMSAQGFVTIQADYLQGVNESVETDNNLTFILT
jgi:hypothetical protein